MVFKVLLHPNAVKELRKLDAQNQARLKQVLRQLGVDPWKIGRPLHPSDFCSIRAGDYRAIYEVNVDQNQVIVLFVGHRKKVYDDFSKLI